MATPQQRRLLRLFDAVERGDLPAVRAALQSLPPNDDGAAEATTVNASHPFDDGSGPTTMRIDRDTNIDGSPAPDGEFSAYGIGGQFSFDEPYADGYQLVLRDLDDVLYDDCQPPASAAHRASASPGGRRRSAAARRAPAFP